MYNSRCIYNNNNNNNNTNETLAKRARLVAKLYEFAWPSDNFAHPPTPTLLVIRPHSLGTNELVCIIMNV